MRPSRHVAGGRLMSYGVGYEVDMSALSREQHERNVAAFYRSITPPAWNEVHAAELLAFCQRAALPQSFILAGRSVADYTCRCGERRRDGDANPQWITNASAAQFEQWFADTELWLRVVFAYEEYLVPTVAPLSRRAVKRRLHPVDHTSELIRVRQLLRGVRVSWTPPPSESARFHFTTTVFTPGAPPELLLTPFAQALRDEWIAPVRESLRYRAEERVYRH